MIRLKSIEHYFIRSLSLTNNAKLAESSKHQSGTQKVPDRVPTGGSFFAELILLFST